MAKTTQEENSESIFALSLVEMGVLPQWVFSQEEIKRGLERGLYTADRVSKAKKLYEDAKRREHLGLLDRILSTLEHESPVDNGNYLAFERIY